MMPYTAPAILTLPSSAPVYQKSLFFTGFAGSGKTTMAKLFESPHRPHINFADEVKAHVASILGITVEDVEARKGELRSYLQAVGHGARCIDSDIWVHKLQRKMINHVAIVCSDVRYFNEAYFARDTGNILIRVWVPDEVRMQRLFDKYKRYPDPAELTHESEIDVPNLPAHFNIRGDMSPESTIHAIVRGIALHTT